MDQSHTPRYQTVQAGPQPASILLLRGPMSTKLIHLLTLGVAVSGPFLLAQDNGKKPGGLFSFVDKLTAKPTGTTYVTLSGKTYQLLNFRKITQEQGQSAQKAMDEKYGFRTYKFGMTLEEFGKAAKEAGETFHASFNTLLSGPDSVTLEVNGQQLLNQVPVQILYGFHKQRLVTVQVTATDSLVTKGKAARLYQAVAEPFGPGLVLRVPPAKNLPMGLYGGVIWYTDKVEILFGSNYDPSEARPRQDDPLAANLRDEEGRAVLTFGSKELLKPYYDRLGQKAKAGI